MARKQSRNFCWMLLSITYLLLSLGPGFLSVRSQEYSNADIDPVNPVALLPGVDYEYYEIDASFDSQIPIRSGFAANVDVSMNDRENDYAFRYSGYLQIVNAGNYTFTIASPDTARFALGGETLVVHTGDPLTPSSGSAALGEGYYTLLIDYSHSDGPDRGLQIDWSSESMAQEALPDGALFRDDPSVTPTPTARPTETTTETATATEVPADGGSTTFLPTSTPTPASPTDGTPTDGTPTSNNELLANQLYLPSVVYPEVEGSAVFFDGLFDGASVFSPFNVRMGARNFEIEPAGTIREGAGHFHLMVDTPCIRPGEQIPNDENHRHYGSGTTEVTLELAAGEHTLCLQAGNGVHTALNLTQEITITVGSGSQEPAISFSQPANGTVLNGRVDVRMVAENFVIEPAGAEIPGHGHFHIMIDTPCINAGDTIPRNATHLHYGQGQTEATLALTPGTHTLCLQAGTGFHTALNLSKIITITVQPEPQVYFLQPQTGATVMDPIQIEMAALNFVIEQAGEARDGAGHFHLMVNEPCVSVGETIPLDENHKHFGSGQSTALWTLPPGDHALCLQAGDGLHTALPLTDTVTIVVAADELP